MKIYLLLLGCCSIFLFVSCQNKTKKLIAKKWDCIKIENLEPLNKNLATKQDSAAAVKIEEALQSLVWTFNSNNTYSCSIGMGTTVQGTYAISADEKTLTLIPVSENNINIYTISNLSEYELTLTSTGTSQPIIMHFRLH